MLSRVSGLAMMFVAGAWLILMLFRIVSVGPGYGPRILGAAIGFMLLAAGAQIFRSRLGTIA